MRIIGLVSLQLLAAILMVRSAGADAMRTAADTVATDANVPTRIARASSDTPLAPPIDAWQPITSHKGQFSVLMPGAVSKSDLDAPGHISRLYYSSPDNGSHIYTVTYTKYSPEYFAGKTRTHVLNDAVHMRVSMLLGRVSKRQFTTLDGFDAMSFEFTGYERSQKHTAARAEQKARGRGLAVLANDIEYVLVCESMTGQEVDSDCEKFLSSFKRMN